MFRLLLGYCVEFARKLHGYCAEIAPDIPSDAARTSAYPLRGYSMDVHRIFGGHESLNDIRGEACL